MPANAKTTVYLDPEDYRRLKAMARQRDSSAAELIREAIAEYTRRHTSRLIPRSVGSGRSGRPDLGERAEELLCGMGRDD
jgi:hypothetical protein